MTDNRTNKNAIFDAEQNARELSGLGPNVPVMTKEEAIFKEFGLDIPTSLVPIPSEGKIYPSSSPLHNASQIEIRGMTTREEDILMSRALIKKGTVITELIKSCIVTPGVDVLSLISGDRNALMVAIRILGYGDLYEASIDCPSCGVKNELQVSLSNLNIKNLEIEPVEPGVNRFRYTLPQTKLPVEFKFLTGREEEEIVATMEMRKKKGLPVDNTVTTRLMHSIVSIKGIDDKSKISKFISVMPALDSAELRHYIDKHEPGIDMSFDFSCMSCDHEERSVLPLGPSFFWPKAGRS